MSKRRKRKLESPSSQSVAWSELESVGAVPLQRKSRSLEGGSGGSGGSGSLVVALKSYLAKHPEYLEHVVMGLIYKARQGDVRCAQLLFDRLDGAVIRQVESRSEVVHVKRLGFLEPEYEVLDSQASDLG